MKNENKILKILKTIEPYYVILSNMLIGFFIMITGIYIIPMIAKTSGEGSYTPFFYALSMIFGFVYFSYYKVFKILIEDDKK